MFIWYICKLEYVIRACGKKWNEAIHKKRECVINTELFERYSFENEQLCKELYLIFEKANQYVHVSLDTYNQEFLIKPIIQHESVL